MKKSVLLASALVLAGLSSSATAAEGSNWFVRGEAGNSDIEVDGAEGSDNAFSARAGYFFTPNFAVEGFYTNYGEDSGDGVSAKLSGFGAGVVGKKNFSANDHTGFFISGRAGVARITTDVSVAGLGSAEDDSVNAYFGVGAGYDFAQNIGLSLNYDFNKAEAFDVDVDAETLTLGFEYRF
ncbi:MAG TPA: porin family protein [Pseudoxanthomonas sp.]